MKLNEAEAELAGLEPEPYLIPLGSWEPIIEGAFLGMSKREWIVAGPRARIGATLRGCSPKRLVDPQKGAKPYKIAPSSMDPATRALHATGIAVATGEPVLCVLGMAAEANGAFFEALNLSGLLRCPVIFLLIRQNLGEDAPVSIQSSADPVKMAKAFGIKALNIPGKSSRVKKAVESARKEKNPTLIIANLES